MEDMDGAIRQHLRSLGFQHMMALGQAGEEGLVLKVQTVLLSHQANRFIEENDRRTQSLFGKILMVMVKILESKDEYTRHHSHEVAKMSRMLGRRKGLSEEELDRLMVAAVFHDFGKIGIPEEVLNKPNYLTDEEFSIMKQHPVIARDILSALDFFSDLLPAITHHHERWDGRGYPDGLRGEEIPLWGRIIAIADAFNTMASVRTYKDPMTPDGIVKQLKSGRGSQFDPELVEILLVILEEEKTQKRALKPQPASSKAS
jgi:HD-GYP domain-containing protein (c-di-GMP phosphodiesterase class II)